MGTGMQKQETYKLLPEFCETTSDEVVVIPGEDYTIQELLEKFVKGNYPKGIERSGLYQEEVNIDEKDIMSDPARDLVDAKEYVDNVNEKVKKLKSGARKRTDKKKDLEDPDRGKVLGKEKGQSDITKKISNSEGAKDSGAGKSD